MKLKLNNAADLHATGEIAGLQNGETSIVSLLAAYAAEQCEDENFEAVIDKSLLADSYRSNPSLLAAKVLVRIQRTAEGWQSCSGHFLSDAQIKICLSQTSKQRTISISGRTSVKQTIKDWLNLNEPRHKKLKLPIIVLPAWYLSHPEQLTYIIKQETQTPIKINKLSRHWLISRK